MMAQHSVLAWYLCVFSGDPDQYYKETLYFVIFQGGLIFTSGSPPPTPSGSALNLWILFCKLCFVSVCYTDLLLHAALWSPVGKGLTSGSRVCVFCHLPIWCPRSGMVFDCIDS